MIDFKVLPEALLFIAGAVPNTLFMAFVSIFFGILFGSFIAVLRLGNNMFINIFFTVFVSFFRAVILACPRYFSKRSGQSQNLSD